MNFSTGLLI